MDTLKQYDSLRASGIPDAQARAQVEVMSDGVSGMATGDDLKRLNDDLKRLDDDLKRLEARLADFATKEDLRNLEVRLTERMDSRMAALRADIRSDIHKLVAALAVGFAVIIIRMFFGG